MPNVVLIFGSAPDEIRCADWPRAAFCSIVVIDNARRVRSDWDYLIHPDDFERLTSVQIKALKVMAEDAVDAGSLEEADSLEDELGYFVEHGRCWEHASDFDEAALDEIDQRWRSSVDHLPAAVAPSDVCRGRRRSSKADRIQRERRLAREVPSHPIEGA
jgi:hypothetical protein